MYFARIHAEYYTLHGAHQASCIHWILARPSHSTELNTPCARHVTTRRRGRPPHNPERRRSTSRSTPQHLTRTRSRSTYSRAPRKHLCESPRFCPPFSSEPPTARHTKLPFLNISGLLLFPGTPEGIEKKKLIVTRNRKYIVSMDTSTHARCFKSGLARRIRIGARSYPSSSAQARNPR